MKNNTELVEEALDEYLTEIVNLLSSEVVIDRSFEDVTKLIPSYEDDSVLHQNDIVYLAKKIEIHKLRTEPKLSYGLIERAADGPLIFYKDQGEINFNSNFYKFARLVTQVAVIMARADKFIADEELNIIKNIIWKLEGISNRERVFLLAKAKYLLIIDTAYDESYRDYIRIALSKENTIKKMELLSNVAKKELLEIAKDIAIADGFLHQSELAFIKEIYRVMGLSVRSAQRDVEDHAKLKFINLKHQGQQISDLFEDEVYEEIEDVLGDLLSDFEDL